MTLDDAAGLTGLIYDAAFDERLWVPVMNRMADAVGGGATALIRKNLTSGKGRGLYGRITEAEFADYYGRFARNNPLAKALVGLSAGAFLIDWQVVRKPRLVQSEYYNEFLLRRDIHGVLGLMVWRQGQEAAVMNLTRPPGRGEFVPEDAARLARFMPHLRRAVAIAEGMPDLASTGLALEGVMHLWPTAMLVLDRAGRPLYANAAAERLLAEQDGLAVQQGVLTASDPQAARRLYALLRAAADPDQPQGGGLTVSRRSARRPYVVRIAPRRPDRGSLFPSPARIVVTVADLDDARPPGAALLRAMLGLSPAQAAVAALLAEGRELREIGAVLGISLNTVRRHLAGVMARTDTHTQARLVQLLTRLADLDLSPERALRH